MMPTDPLIFVAETWMYEAGELAQFYDGLGVPYRTALQSDPARSWSEAEDATHLVVARANLPGAVLAKMPRLRAIVKWGRGTERIDVSEATKRGIVVAYTPHAVQGVAEAALLLMLALSKALPLKVEAGRSGTSANDLPEGSELQGKVLGLIGFGSIGQSVARMAFGIGMRILIHELVPNPAAAAACEGEFVPLEELLAKADYVSLHTSAMPDAPPILDARHVAQMKRGAYLVNTARGSLVDERALIAALESGRLAGAGLDVVAKEPLQADNPLVHMDNVIVTPHTLGITRESMGRIKDAVRESLRLLLDGRLPPFVANPEVEEARDR